MRVVLILAILLAQISTTVAQDKIQLMNGRVLRGKILGQTDDFYKFKYYKKGGKQKDIDLLKYRVFSITDVKGMEEIVYKRDTLSGSFYTTNQMKMLVYGQRDAFNKYQSAPLFIGSFALGFAATVLDTYEFAGPVTGFYQRTPSIGPIGVPLVITIGAGVLRSKVRREYASDVAYLNNEFYIQGFQKVAKYKRVKAGFLGSVLGVASGIVAYNILKP